MRPVGSATVLFALALLVLAPATAASVGNLTGPGDLGSAIPNRHGAELRASSAAQVELSTYDGTLESGIAFLTPTPGNSQFVQRLDLPTSSSTLLSIEACFFALSATPDFDFQYVLYDGSSQPGALLASFSPTVATPLSGTGFDCFAHALAAPLALAPNGQIFLGVAWDQSQFQEAALATDTNSPNSGPMFQRQGSGEFVAIPPGAGQPPANNLGLSAIVDDGAEPPGGGGSGTCTPSSTTLCLQDGRFRVEVSFRAQSGQSGAGQIVPGGTESAANIFFFDPNNWEMLFKILNGCPINDHWWVFFAATTDVEFTATVVDTATDTTQTYTNPLGQPANAVTDTSAFATCP